jgi:Tol biopolymer transport system component
MALASGTKVGPYEIVALIGAGGMGEVYRARDARLGRDVALKLLPATFASDAERLRRFEQEARAVAALSHPNILAVYDIGQYEGAPYLVSELLEGESLREVLARGVLSHRRALDYAGQMAHGLAAAHSKDIAHRDLKPDNIFITRDGRVKILDFGLAKSILQPAVRPGVAAGATMTAAAPVTEVGTVMGTAGYMSPEQVRGVAVDCRTDIFSFGAVLYEMLTGQRAFKRDTTADTMAAILNEDPPELLESGRQIPPALDRIVRHCLEKAPDHRFQSARDLAFDLESLSSLTGSGNVVAIPAKQRRKWLYVGAGALLIAIAAAVALAVAASRGPVTNSQFHQLTYRLGTLGTARFTPDGQNVIYTAMWEGSPPEIYTVPANGAGGHPLDIHNARLLSVSSRGEIAVALSPREATPFLVSGTLARTTQFGGAPKPQIEDVAAADFTPDGADLAIVRVLFEDRICQLEYPVGKVLYRAVNIDAVRFSPDGRYLAFIAHDNAGDDRGTVIILRSTGEKAAVSPVYQSAQGLAWSRSGEEVWTTSPLETGEIHAMNLSGKVRQPLAVPGRLFLQDISPNGQLLVRQGIARRGMVIGQGNSQRDVSWLDFGYLRDISRDGKTILFEEEGSETQNYIVFVRDLDGSPATPIGEGYGVALSPDKRWALAQKLPEVQLWLLPLGPGAAKRISPPNLHAAFPANFLSDGRRVVYTANEPGHRPRVWLQDLSGGTPRPLTAEGFVGNYISPDDKWLVTYDVHDTAQLLSIDTGKFEGLPFLKQNQRILGWTADGQLYVMTLPSEGRSTVHIDKVNPHTGAATPWRDLALPPIEGVFPETPVITLDGSTYGFGYRLRLWDLYTVSGVR